MKISKYVIGIAISVMLILHMQNGINAQSQASGTNYRLGNWTQNNGAGEAPESALSYRIHQASVGIPVIGIIKSRPTYVGGLPGEGGIPTYDNILWTGFLFVAWFVTYNVDDNYDIDEIYGYHYKGGPALEESAWTNDEDPYFTWQIRRMGLEVEGYSYAFDELPDRVIDSVDPEYQAPNYTLSEGEHAFYVIAKSMGNTWGNVGLFEIWVDTQVPTISEIIPSDADVINNNIPTIQATVMDNLSGIDPDAITFLVETAEGVATVLPNYDAETGIITYQPAEPLVDGFVTVELAVADFAGNSTGSLLWTFSVDTASPSGSVQINNDAAATDTNIVTLQIVATEMETELDAMMISNDSAFEGALWEPYVTEKANWVLDPVAGVKTVFIKFRDLAGNESEIVSDSIVLTITSPNTFIIEAPPSITQMTSAAFSYSATEAIAQFYYRIDNEAWVGPTDDTTINFSDLAIGNHYFQVKAGFDVDSSGVIDPDEIDMSPAVVSWSIGTLNPTTVYSERPIKYYRRE